MLEGRDMPGRLIVLGACAAACLTPWAWIALPAAGALVLWLPGQRLVELLPQIRAAAGGAWMAVAAAMVLMPVPLAWVWRFSNDRLAVLGVVLAINLLLVLVAGRKVRRPRAEPMFTTRGRRGLFAVMVTWVAVWVFAAYWAPAAVDGVSTPSAHDFIKHHAVLLSLEHDPLPLHSIFYAAEADQPYYYYEYHYLVPAALRTLCGNRLSIPLVFGLTSAVVAATFMGLVYLMARQLLGGGRGPLLAVACVSVVGGWDIVPVLLRVAGGTPMVVVLDSWCPVFWRIQNCATQYLWCPQHVSAGMALTLCGLWLPRAPAARWWIVIVPLLGASVFGSSVYLAMTVFPAAAAYALMRIRTAPADGVSRGRMAAAIGAMACLGLLLMSDQAWQYFEMSGRHTGGLTAEWPRFRYALLGRAVEPGPLANLLDMPWLVLVQFGVSGVGLLLASSSWWRSAWRDAGFRLMILSAVIGVLALFCVRSDMSPIDYGFRASMLPALTVGAICAGAMISRGDRSRLAPSKLRIAVAAGVMLGLPVGLYELPMMSGRHLLGLHEGRADYWGADAGAIRFLRDQAPANAVVQPDPIQRVALPQLINRQMGILDPENPHVNVFRPVDMQAARQALAEVELAFGTDSSRVAYERLRAQQVTHVLVGTVEHRRFGQLRQFDDPSLFDVVYRDGKAAVYALRQAPPVSTDPNKAR